MDSGRDGFGHHCGFARRSHADGSVDPWNLIERDQNLFALTLEVPSTYIVIYAYDLPRLIGSEFLHAGNDLLYIQNLPDGILAGQVMAHEFLIDHGHTET